jgi:uncharacterized protein YggE
MKRLYATALILISGLPLFAQTTPGTVQATGTANVSVKPDQAQLSLSVVTDGATAQQAAEQNATLANAVIGVVGAVLGSTGSIQTSAYSIYPRYGNGANPSIIGYTASNTLQVTTSDLNLPGKIIDAASQAGANSVGSLSFGVRDPEPFIKQALTAASKQALAHAAAIAAGLGGNVGTVISASEGSNVVPMVSPVGVGAASTPILTGTVSVSATVTISAQLTQ